MDQAIPLAVPDLRGNEQAYLARCVTENWVSSAGPFVSRCELEMASLAGRRNAVATVNGTSAIHLALIAAGVSTGDYVVLPDWTFAATANAVVHAGCIPVFVDVTEESWTLDPSSLSRVLSNPPGRIGAVIAVHALGHPADIDALLPLCRAAGLPLIEDAAGAIGARYKRRPAGGLGDLAIFSFNGNKTVTAGGGGMVVTVDEDKARPLRALSEQERSGTEYRYDAVGFNYRMTNVNAALLLAQIERLGDMLSAKRRVAEAYDRALSGRNDLVPMPRRPWAESGCWLYSVLCRNEPDAQSLVRHMADRKIEARVFWRTLSDQEPYAGTPTELSGMAARLSGTVVSLPCSSSLTASQQARVLDALAQWSPQRRAH